MKKLILILLSFVVVNVYQLSAQQHGCWSSTSYKTVDDFGLHKHPNSPSAVCISNDIIAYYTSSSGIRELKVRFVKSEQVKGSIVSSYVSLDNCFMVDYFSPPASRMEIQEMCGPGQQVIIEHMKLEQYGRESMIAQHKK